MGKWKPDCRSNVAHMSDGDFFANEQAAVIGE
jgi:monomeric isocitrate dehydrogenase